MKLLINVELIEGLILWHTMFRRSFLSHFLLLNLLGWPKIQIYNFERIKKIRSSLQAKFCGKSNDNGPEAWKQHLM